MKSTIHNLPQRLEALGRGESLPSAYYTDPSITEQEIQQIFRKSWNYIGSLQKLTNLGDYITGYVGDVPVVVLRNEQGLSGFINVCRHRKHEVMKGCGNAKMMQCCYHAWTYDLTGCLKKVPRSEKELNFNLKDYPLLPLRVDTLGPFVFANLNAEAKPLQEYFGDVLKKIGNTGINLNTLQQYNREEWVSNSNWKTMLENYLECYHCSVAHPGLSAAIDVRQENYKVATHDWYFSHISHVRESALASKNQVKIYNIHGDVTEAQYYLLWPNMTININPGFPNLSVDIWIPNGPNSTRGFSEQYFAPGVSETFAQEMLAFNQKVGAEDDALTNSVQRGLLAGIPEKCRLLTNSEQLVIDFQKLVAKTLADTPPVTDMKKPIPSKEKNGYFAVEIFKIEPESDVITSYYLRRVDGKKLDPWMAGQFLPIRVNIPGQEKPLVRFYTLSTTANPDYYRISVRHGDANAKVSNFFHQNAKPGLRIEAMKPRGKFVLDRLSERPVVLISGGVGITPMIAMTNDIIEEGRRTGKFRRSYFIHGSDNSAAHAFSTHMRRLAKEYPSLTTHFVYNKPLESDQLGVTHNSEGFITSKVLQKVLQFNAKYDFYLCGPAQFMRTVYNDLIGLNVDPKQIFYEVFGDEPTWNVHTEPICPNALKDEVLVHFAKSGITVPWSPDKGSLLELAEEAGLGPAFGCRSGSCGSCATTMTRGRVKYATEPLSATDDKKILLCCSVPNKAAMQKESGDPKIVLDL